jgi:hypothetical protein
MPTNKYALEEIPIGTTGWNAILTDNMQVIDDVIHTHIQGVAGETIAAGQAVYLKSDGKFWKALANHSSTMPALGLAVADASANDPMLIQRIGPMTNSEWSWDTIGGVIYVSASEAGLLTQTAPELPNHYQPMGVALSAISMLITAGNALATKNLSIGIAHIGDLRLGGVNNKFGVASISNASENLNSVTTTLNLLLAALRKSTGCGVLGG